MKNLLKRYKKHFGYTATIEELYSLYTQGELRLNTKDENTLLKSISN